MAAGLIMLYIFALFCEIVSLASGYLYTLPAGGEECFYEKTYLENDALMRLYFEVKKGGSLDIDVTVYDPQENTLERHEAVSSGKYIFNATHIGLYRYCFSNKRTTLYPKLIMFYLSARMKRPWEDYTEVEKGNILFMQLFEELQKKITEVEIENQFTKARKVPHMMKADSTLFRVNIFFAFQCLVTITLIVGQVWYLKKLTALSSIV